jgi:lipopolysaccharide/colanic/teichoic acid biosynthesis glycosyltransferase
MTNRTRLISGIVLAILPFVARWAHQEWRAPPGTTEALLPYALLAAMCVLVAVILNAPARTTSVSEVAVGSMSATLLMLGASATSQVFFPDTLPRFVMLLTAVLAMLWLFVFGSIMAILLRRSGGASRVVAVISRKDADQLVRDVEDGPFEQHFVLVAVVTDEAAYPSISGLCTDGRATTLVLGPRASVHPVVVEHAASLHRSGLRVRSLDDFYDESLGKLPLSALDRLALMGDIESLHGAYAPLKRAIDLILAFVGMIAIVALSPIILIGNLLGNRGPLLFTQDRVGLNGEPFRIWKLRTMSPGAADISGWTSNDDPRITPFGRVLRRTHIDELPQMINIVIGELAVVGPRPEQVAYSRKLEEALPFYSARHLVRPGLTGWAQVKYRYAASEEDAFVKLQYDLHYVRHESLATDLRIIWLTLHHLVTDGGR